MRQPIRTAPGDPIGRRHHSREQRSTSDQLLRVASSSFPTSPPIMSSPQGREAAVLTCQHARKEHGWEVVVEVEDPAHQEEREVMEHPSQEQLATSSQQHLGQPCVAQSAQPNEGRGSAGRAWTPA